MLHHDSSSWKGLRLGDTALHYVARADKDPAQLEKAKILLRHNPNCVRFANNKGWTPLAFAVRDRLLMAFCSFLGL